MNNRGFTLIELLATIVVLAIVSGIVVVSVNGSFSSTRDNTEEVFVDTIKDAMEVYLSSSESKSLTYSLCSNKISKTHGDVLVYKSVITLSDVIDSKFHPITETDLVNPANKGVSCGNPENINIEIYRDDDYVYYYKILRSSLTCLKKTDGYISNLPLTDGEEYYSCN